MKRKMRKFETGGPTSYAESGSAGGSNISFKEAFKEARKAGLDEFTWRGKKYTTELASAKKSDDSEPAKVKKTETTTEVETPSSDRVRSGGRGSKPASAKIGTGRYDDPTTTYMDRVLSPFKRLTGGNLFGQREVERVARGAGVSTEEARRRLREAGMNRGGSVNKYAKGGSVGSSASRRADGCATKGKTRGKFV